VELSVVTPMQWPRAAAAVSSALLAGRENSAAAQRQCTLEFKNIGCRCFHNDVPLLTLNKQ